MNNELLKNKRNRSSEEEIKEIPFIIVKNIEITNNCVYLTLSFKNYIRVTIFIDSYSQTNTLYFSDVKNSGGQD
jgi:hypothetical protein